MLLCAQWSVILAWALRKDTCASEGVSMNLKSYVPVFQANSQPLQQRFSFRLPLNLTLLLQLQRSSTAYVYITGPRMWYSGSTCEKRGHVQSISPCSRVVSAWVGAHSGTPSLAAAFPGQLYKLPVSQLNDIGLLWQAIATRTGMDSCIGWLLTGRQQEQALWQQLPRTRATGLHRRAVQDSHNLHVPGVREHVDRLHAAQLIRRRRHEREPLARRDVLPAQLCQIPCLPHSRRVYEHEY